MRRSPATSKSTKPEKTENQKVTFHVFGETEFSVCSVWAASAMRHCPALSSAIQACWFFHGCPKTEDAKGLKQTNKRTRKQGKQRVEALKRQCTKKQAN
jgi:FPC/CPF motif-containing protein YcgG